MRFYYDHGNLYALTKLNMFYKVPIYVDNSATVVQTEKRDYYFDGKNNACQWFLNDKEQRLDAETKQAVDGYVKGVVRSYL